MDHYIYRLEKLPLTTVSARREAEAFLARHDLQLDASLQHYYGVFRGEQLIGGAGYGADVIKCVAVDPAYRGEGIVNALFSRIMTELHQQGIHNIFLFTKPENELLFADLSFHTVEKTPEVLLMESDRRAFPAYLQGLRALRGEGRTGAIVMNCNPFTLGHQYLVETARARCDRLILFVVEEDASEFPYADRIRLVREGVAHLPGVTVAPGGAYIISAATFPTYFLKDASKIAVAHTRLDITIFGRHIAPSAGIGVRFAGEEPYSEVTRMYNEAMQAYLPPLGVEVQVVPRKQYAQDPISASRVRGMIAAGQLEQTRDLVPESTYLYLIDPQTGPILQRIRNK